MTDGPGAPGSFFGRRKGKRLRSVQEARIATLLPAVRLPDPAASDLRALFPRPVDAMWLEIGFGGGEHLAAQAKAHPEIGFVGVEPFVNGVAKLLAAIGEHALDNIRVSDEDASRLLPTLPAAAFDRVYLLFPDPWPKRRQRKRRFVSDDNLGALARVMRPGAELRFATDIDDYAGWALERVRRSPDFAWTAAGPDDWRRPWAGWPGTRYEAKARLAGRPSSYLTFRRI